MSATKAPRSENGVLFVGAWRDTHLGLIQSRWRSATVDSLNENLRRIDLSNTPRGSCPGFNDATLLATLSTFGMAFGFFCDGISCAEGVRVFENGKQRECLRVDWKSADPPDPIAWPISFLARSLRIPLEQVTRVERPSRPEIALAVEAMLVGEEPKTRELAYLSLQILGSMPLPEATAVLAERLKSDDWVERFHAARGYARMNRGQGANELPELQSLLDDEDESVREAALEGAQELLQVVAFTNPVLHAQIDAAISRGLEDDDEDVRAAATNARDLRVELLG